MQDSLPPFSLSFDTSIDALSTAREPGIDRNVSIKKIFSHIFSTSPNHMEIWMSLLERFNSHYFQKFLILLRVLGTFSCECVAIVFYYNRTQILMRKNIVSEENSVNLDSIHFLFFFLVTFSRNHLIFIKEEKNINFKKR